MKPRIAIIGAGISGLTLAQQLMPHAQVQVFEKARGVGGRMSTRYADPFYFDHGTQFFTARDPHFQAFLAPLIAQGSVAEWKGKVITLSNAKRETDRIWFEPHYVATPHMNSLCKALSAGVDVRTGTQVAPLAASTHAQAWALHNTEGASLGTFDWVISTAPPAQTLALFGAHLAPDSALHRTASMRGCYALMLGFNTGWRKSWIAAEVHDSPLQWISVNSSKPARNNEVTSLVVHSRNDWADAHMDDDLSQAQQFLLSEFEALTGINGSAADYIATHRWKYALSEKAQPQAFLLDGEQKLAAVGDWSSASRIEDAWLNATALSKALLS